MTPAANRRRFLRYLAASPVLAASAEALAQAAILPDPMVWGPRQLEKLITFPGEATNVFDFEPVMHKHVQPAHFGYMATGVDDETTLRANRDGFKLFQLRPRRLIDVSVLDTRMELFGTTYANPIVIAPTASNKAFHPEGELAVAKAARTANHLQMLSTVATTSVEEATEARGAPVWFQLYPTNRWEIAEALAARAEKAGAGTIVVTIDTLGRQNWETLARLQRSDASDCGSCHAATLRSYLQRKPNFDRIDVAGIGNISATNLTWEILKRLRDTVRTKLVIKGVLAEEDAALAVDNGLDGIVVSNHGGRALDTGRSTIEALPGILDAVDDRIPVLVDSGFRRGTDIAKALALGARGVCIGRPYLWGLGAFGQAGVERVLELLRLELRAAMMQLGAPSLKQLVPEMVRRI